MDSNLHETRPLKRRRMEMAPPDGFAATTSRKPVYKPVVPQFSSAFNEDRASDPASTFKPSSSDKESTDNLKERRPVLSNQYIVEGADKLKERSFIQGLHALAPSKPDSRPYTPRTSILLPPLQGSLLISSQLKTHAPVLQLRPPPKPPIIPSYHAPITTSVPLKPAVPPLPLLANKHSSKDLKSLQPPPVPLPLNPAITALEKDCIMHTSFIRGGLAARASAFFEQSQTSLVLWQKETERRAHALSSSDLRVNIIKILQKPLLSHTASKNPFLQA